MTRFVAFLLFMLSSPAWAGVPCTLPFNLTNGTTADATQVMANYNALTACLLNAATAGANSDITSLNGITTPIPHTAGGTATYIGGTSGGSANAQTLSATVPTFVLQAGTIVTFIAGASNTGPLQVNIASTGLKNVYRHSQLGATMSVGAEILAGEQVVLQYDGAEYQCMSCAKVLIGEIKTYAGLPTAPAGWLIIDGSCQPQVTYADLFTTVGSVYGSCGAGLFALPDGRGRIIAGYDNQGTNGDAGRMTSCAGRGSGGGTCGAQSETIAQANLPNVALSTASITMAISGGGSNVCNNGSCTSGNNSFATTSQTPSSVNVLTNGGITNTPYTFSFGGSVPLGGSGTAVPVIQPTAFTYTIIKY